MMIIVKSSKHKFKLKVIEIFIIILFSSSSNLSLGKTIEQQIDDLENKQNNKYEEDLPITTDNRIKTYIYNPNEVYLLVLHYGFQSHIEFAKGEEIQTITAGDTYSWKITPLNNRLFIKPLESNIRTNMTIITSKRTYQLDIVSKHLEEGEEKDLVYVLRFYYPKIKSKQL